MTTTDHTLTTNELGDGSPGPDSVSVCDGGIPGVVRSDGPAFVPFPKIPRLRRGLSF